MGTPTVLVSTWRGGLLSVRNGTVHQEIADGLVTGLAGDGRGGVIMVVGGGELRRRSSDSAWSTLTVSDFDLACCVAAQPGWQTRAADRIRPRGWSRYVVRRFGRH